MRRPFFSGSPSRLLSGFCDMMLRLDSVGNAHEVCEQATGGGVCEGRERGQGRGGGVCGDVVRGAFFFLIGFEQFMLPAQSPSPLCVHRR